MTRHLSFDHNPKMLALRRSGTTEVALFWSRRTGRAAVAVEDAATGDRFELPINPDDNPLDLYNHPYAYAARRREDRADEAGSNVPSTETA